MSTTYEFASTLVDKHHVIWNPAGRLRSFMDSTVLIPLLFPMEVAFADLCDGKSIQVLHEGTMHLGRLFVTHQEPQDFIGVSIQFGPSLVEGNFPSTTDGSFVTTGHAGLQIHHLSLDEIGRIKRTGDPSLPYALSV